MASWQSLLTSRGFLFLAAAAVTFSGVVVGSQYAFYEDGSELKLGETWVYEHQTSFSASWSEAGESGSVEESMSGRVTFRIVDTNASVAGQPAYAMRVTEEDSRHGDVMHLSKKNLNPIWQEGPNETFELQLFKFPLHAGQSWTQTIPEEELKLHFDVANRDLLPTPMGRMEAYRIEVTPEIPQEMMEDEDVEVDVQVAYWFAPKIKYLAAAEVIVDVQDRNNPDNVFRSESRMTIVEHKVVDPSQLPDVDLDIEGPDLVNAATRGKATFKAVADGLPEGGEFLWYVDGESVYDGSMEYAEPEYESDVDPDYGSGQDWERSGHMEVQSASGNTLDLQLRDPGMHKIEVEAYDAAGNLLARAAHDVEAMWHIRESGDLGYLYDGYAWEFPVTFESTMVKTSFDIDSVSAPLARDALVFESLTVYNEEGGRIGETSQPGEELVVEDPSDQGMGMWRAELRYNNYGGDLDATYDFELTVRYGSADVTEATTTMETSMPGLDVDRQTVNPFRDTFITGPTMALDYL